MTTLDLSNESGKAVASDHGEDFMKFVDAHPFSNPETAARRLLGLANAFEPIQDGRIYIEKLNGPLLFELKGTPAKYKAGLDYAIAKGWLIIHESGTLVRLTEAGAALFA